MTAEAAAEKLMTAVYRSEIQKSDLDRPLIARGGTIFERSALSDLAEAIWPPAESRRSAKRRI